MVWKIIIINWKKLFKIFVQTQLASNGNEKCWNVSYLIIKVALYIEWQSCLLSLYINEGQYCQLSRISCVLIFAGY